MKKLLLYLTVFALVGSACSSKFGFAKRKYVKGYYLSVSHKPKAAQETVPEKSKKSIPAAEKVTQVIVPPQDLNAAVAGAALPTPQNNTSGTVQIAKKSTAAPKTNSALLAHNGSQPLITSSIPVKNLDNKQLATRSAAKGGGDTNTILLVILCLFWFLNLVAVYLHQGKSITTDFWITLILDLLIIFGIIYSILVVLDVLSFA